MQWTIQEVSRSLRAPVPIGVEAVARVAGVSIDSRTIASRQLFVAIRGPVHDGHRFVESALQSGSVAAIVSESSITQYPSAVRAKLIGVPDTLGALQELARAVRRKWGRRIAAVTGSV